LQACSDDFYMIEAKPENLIGDRAYDSDPLDSSSASRVTAAPPGRVHRAVPSNPKPIRRASGRPEFILS
jgi:hypothetical protein